MSNQSVGTSSAGVVAAVADYLDDLTRRAHARLGEVAGVAVTMALEGEGPVTAGASTQLVRSVDALQYAIGQGPCLDALAGRGGDYVPDLGADDRWGDYGPRAASLGARCCLSVPVRAGDTAGADPDEPDRVIAVAKVYATEVDGLDAAQQQVGRDLASEVAAGIRLVRTLRETARELSDRAEAMNSRRAIDLAVGMLMERVGCDADRAFALLRQYSQTRNVRLHDVAVDLVAGSGDEAEAEAQPEQAQMAELLAAVRTSADSAPFRPRGAPPMH